MSSRPTTRVGFSFENLMWIFTRISGLLIILLALTGLVGAFILGARLQMGVGDLLRWTFFPISSHVINTNIPDVTLGWLNGFWNVMQILIIFFAVSHGANGLRLFIEDYISASWLQILIRGLLFLIWLFALIVAVYVVLTVNV